MRKSNIVHLHHSNHNSRLDEGLRSHNRCIEVDFQSHFSIGRLMHGRKTQGCPRRNNHREQNSTRKSEKKGIIITRSNIYRVVEIQQENITNLSSCLEETCTTKHTAGTMHNNRIVQQPRNSSRPRILYHIIDLNSITINMA